MVSGVSVSLRALRGLEDEHQTFVLFKDSVAEHHLMVTERGGGKQSSV